MICLRNPFCVFLISLFIISPLSANDSLNIAVTSSFKPVIDALTEPFYDATGITLRISSASTGVLYQQSVSGAPFDVFFAADTLRPASLVKKLSLPDSQLVPYAKGRLVLVSNDNNVQSLADLASYANRLVIANPKHAPYGIAAEKVLLATGHKSSLILANNVNQARQYLQLGLADVGLIAASVSQGFSNVVEIPDSRYDAIIQSLVVLEPSPQTQALITFLKTDFAQQTLIDFGYEQPE